MRIKIWWLFTSISLLIAISVQAQEQDQEVGVYREKHNWYAGIELLAPILVQFDNYAGWKQATQSEVFTQYRRGEKAFGYQLMLVVSTDLMICLAVT